MGLQRGNASGSGLFAGAERAFDGSNDLSENDLVGRAAERIPPVSAAFARHEAGILQKHEDTLEELDRNFFPLGDLMGLGQADGVGLRKVQESLECIKTSPGDFHKTTPNSMERL